MSAVLLALVLLLSPAMAAPPQESDAQLLQEELRDAAVRQRQELDERIDELEAQAEILRELENRQEDYIRQLKTHIQALKAEGKPQ